MIVGDVLSGSTFFVLVIAILAFVWLTPPDWLRDPMASGGGPVCWLINALK